MKLKAILDTLDGLDAAIADLYVEFDAGDGTTKHRLDIEGINDHPDVKQLKTAFERQKTENRTVKGERDAANARLVGLPDDFTAETYDDMVARLEAKPGSKTEDEIRTEATKAANAAAEAKYQPKVTAAEGERDKFRDQLDNRIKREAIDEQLDEAGITLPAYRKAARGILMPSLKIVEDDGERLAIASDPDLGERPVAEHVKAWAGTDEGKAFVAPRESAGGGADGKPGRRDADDKSNPWKQGPGFNVTNQARISREDPTLAAKLKHEAGVG